jgi:hypothetical protein
MQFNYREWRVKAKNENKCVGLQSAELRIRLNANVRNGDQQNANHAGFIISKGYLLNILGRKKPSF